MRGICFRPASISKNSYRPSATKNSKRRYGRRATRTAKKYLTFPLPTIAALNGPAIAGGFDLATMCDLRVACPETYFLHPEIAFGEVMYGPLHDLVGGALARELCLTGRRVNADEALAIHLVSGIVRCEQLLEEAGRYAQMIAQAPREVCKATKSKIVNRAGFAGRKTLAL